MHFPDAQVQLEAESRHSIERGLSLALEQNQLVLHYQAQVDHEQKIQGFEALIRWQHPHHGLLYPSAFIKIAEETKLINPIGQWALNETCKLLAQWSKDSDRSKWTISINVSPVQLEQPEFVHDVLSSIESAQIDPRFLCLELTGSLIKNSHSSVKQKIQALKTAGVRISLDHFGEGSVSPSEVEELPVDELKIPAGYFKRIETEPKNAAVLKSIIEFGNIMKLRVIAEGIETETQFRQLRDYGCCLFQGYYFGRPEPIDRFSNAGNC